MNALRLILVAGLGAAALQSLVSCASEPKKRERVPPPVTDSGRPWNIPQKWEAQGRFGSMMPQSR